MKSPEETIANTASTAETAHAYEQKTLTIAVTKNTGDKYYDDHQR